MIEKKRNTGVQALRGIACLMVVLNHFVAAFDGNNFVIKEIIDKSPLCILHDGQVGVDIFFALSGFFYYKVIDEKYKTKVVNRLARLYPLYFFSVMFGLIARMTSWRGLIIHGTAWLNQNWGGNKIPISDVIKWIIFFPTFDTTMINSVLWTMKVELLMAFVLPFVLFGVKKLNGIIVYFICLGTALLFSNSTYFGFLSFLPEFVIGMIGGKVARKVDLYNWNLKERWDGIFLAIGIIFLESRLITSLVGIVIPAKELIERSMTSLGTVLVLLVLLEKNVKSTILSKIGDYSFYIYLTHFVVLLWFRFILDDFGYGLYICFCIAFTILSAVAFRKLDLMITLALRKMSLLRKEE